MIRSKIFWPMPAPRTNYCIDLRDSSPLARVSNFLSRAFVSHKRMITFPCLLRYHRTSPHGRILGFFGALTDDLDGFASVLYHLISKRVQCDWKHLCRTI